jgi:hypothetical protein
LIDAPLHPFGKMLAAGSAQDEGEARGVGEGECAIPLGIGQGIETLAGIIAKLQGRQSCCHAARQARRVPRDWAIECRVKLLASR